MAIRKVVVVAHAVEKARTGACEIGGKTGIERLRQLKISPRAVGIGSDGPSGGGMEEGVGIILIAVLGRHEGWGYWR